MPNAARHSITRIVPNKTFLNIEGLNYPIAGFSSDWAINEIPRAQCTLAPGIDMGVGELASIHKRTFTQMVPATVVCALETIGGASTDRDWDGKTMVLFTGYVSSVSGRKIMGKYQLQINLVHWLFDLACSSMISGETHPGNAASLSVPALMNAAPGSVNRSSYISLNAYSHVLTNFSQLLGSDFWGAIKALCTFYAANTSGSIFRKTCDSAAGKSNVRALGALSRIEGPLDPSAVKALKAIGSLDTSKPYRYGQKLTILGNELGDDMNTRIANGIGNESVYSLGSVSIWDKLVSHFCPMFGLAIVPMIDSAVVIADTPILSKFDQNMTPQVWMDVYAEEIDSIDSGGDVDRPLRGVMVVAPTDARILPETSTVDVLPGGCFLQNKVGATDGVLLPVGPPSWLYPAPGDPGIVGPSFLYRSPSLAGFYRAWAQDVYTKNTLRGRTQTFSGVFRLDIAPGSIVRVRNTSDKLLVQRGGIEEDMLSMDGFGCVARMSTYLNAEAPAAGCAYQLSYARHAGEYFDDTGRTAVSAHPFFGNAIHGQGLHGAPLLAGAEDAAFYKPF